MLDGLCSRMYVMSECVMSEFVMRGCVMGGCVMGGCVMGGCVMGGCARRGYHLRNSEPYVVKFAYNPTDEVAHCCARVIRSSSFSFSFLSDDDDDEDCFHEAFNCLR